MIINTAIIRPFAMMKYLQKSTLFNMIFSTGEDQQNLQDLLPAILMWIISPVLHSLSWSWPNKNVSGCQNLIEGQRRLVFLGSGSKTGWTSVTLQSAGYKQAAWAAMCPLHVPCIFVKSFQSSFAIFSNNPLMLQLNSFHVINILTISLSISVSDVS